MTVTMIHRTMFAGLWLAAIAASILTLRTGGGAFAALALAPVLGAALATSFYPGR